MAIVRHKGIVRSTGSRVFVLWRECPDDPTHCLVIYQDSLPEAFSVPVVNLINGVGQRDIDLWKVMHEIGVIEGANMLTVLHKYGYIRKQNTVDVDMHVGDNKKIALNLLNAEIDHEIQLSAGTVKDVNPFELRDQEAKDDDYPEKNSIVKSLLADAKKYEELSKNSYERAYKLEPSLRPVPESTSQNSEKSDKSTLVLELPADISQTKAIEMVKSAMKAFKEAHQQDGTD